MIALQRSVAAPLGRAEPPHRQPGQPLLARMANRLGDRQRAPEGVLRLAPGPPHGRALALDPPRPALELPRSRPRRDLEALLGEVPRAVGVAPQQRELTEARVAVRGVAPRHPARRRRMLDGMV